jgi:Amt family ammonium transporter
LALGAWILTVGWFGFNVMSAQTLDKMSGLVAVNSLMAMVGGTLAALLAGKNDPGFVHNGPLAGLVAVCAGSDVMHPIGALVVGAVAGVLFVRTADRHHHGGGLGSGGWSPGVWRYQSHPGFALESGRRI